jgi:hypothetical protein
VTKSKDEMGGAFITPGRCENAYRIFIGNPERDCLKDPGVNGGTVLQWISKKSSTG